MLTILLGAADSGKTTRIAEDIREKMASRRDMVLLTPEQQSHRAERRLSALCGPALNLHGEVLSFTRMANRVAAEQGGLADALPDRSGRLLLMTLALDSVAEKLRRGGGRRRLEDLRQLMATAEELRGALLTPEVLLAASERTGGTLRDKLWDMALVLESYEAVTEQQLGDRRDAVTRLAAGIGESSVGRGGIWADGFTDFTAAELQVLEAVLRRGSDLTVALTLPEGENGAYAVTESCFRSLLEMAERRGTEVRVLRLPDPARDPIRYLSANLFAYEAPSYRSRKEQAELCRMDSFAGECRWAAARIRELMAGDPSLRFSDFALAVPAFRSRRGTLEAVLREYGLPFFVEETQELGQTGLAVYLLGAVEAVTGAWRGRDLVRCLRTGFGGLRPEETDELENYCLTWDLRGESTWRREEAWDLSPGGYGQKKDSDEETLRRLHSLRQRVAGPFGALADALRDRPAVHDKLMALAVFLEETGVRETLGLRSRRLAAAGETAGAAACLRLWGAVSECLEQMDAVLGDAELLPEEFLRLLELLFQGREAGSIPAALDAVSLGSPARLRGMKPRVLLVLGADDDSLPEQPGEAGIFSEEEKRSLLDLGIRLGAGQEEELTRPLLDLCALASAPRERLLMSWSGGEDSRPSLLIQRAVALLGATMETDPLSGGGTWPPLRLRPCPWPSGRAPGRRPFGRACRRRPWRICASGRGRAGPPSGRRPPAASTAGSCGSPPPGQRPSTSAPISTSSSTASGQKSERQRSSPPRRAAPSSTMCWKTSAAPYGTKAASPPSRRRSSAGSRPGSRSSSRRRTSGPGSCGTSAFSTSSAASARRRRPSCWMWPESWRRGNSGPWILNSAFRTAAATCRLSGWRISPCRAPWTGWTAGWTGTSSISAWRTTRRGRRNSASPTCVTAWAFRCWSISSSSPRRARSATAGRSSPPGSSTPRRERCC